MRVLSFVPFLLAVAACGPPPLDAADANGQHPKSGADAGTAPGQSLGAERIANVPAGTFGPYVADTVNGTMVVWAAAEGNGRSWYGVVLDTSGKPGGVTKLGAAPSEVGLAVLEPSSKDFVLLYTSHDGERTIIDALTISASAKAAAPPKRVAEVTGEVIWIDLVATTRDSLALWAVRRQKGADLFASALSQSGSVEVVTGVTAWQSAPFGDAAAIGIVSGGDARGGKVDLVTLDFSGKTRERTAVSSSPTAEADLDMVGVGSGLLFAFTDRRDVDEHVYVAAVDASGKVVAAPAPGPAPLGDQALVRLVPAFRDQQVAYLAWEDLGSRPEAGRTIRVAKLSNAAKLGAERAEIRHYAPDSVPELTASQDGLAALTLAPSCAKAADCAQAPRVATFVELDQAMAVKTSEPLRVGALGGEAPELSWGLSCARSPCRVLGAQASDPAPIYWVELSKTGIDWQPAARRVAKQPPPRPTYVRAIAQADPIADMSATRLDGATLAAWVTDFDPNAPWQRLTKPAPDGRFDPVRATLGVRAIPDGKDPLPAETISIRARSLGGVAIRAGAGDSKEALVAWTALDNKIPQVFVTVVDAHGKKLRQRMLTRAPGEKSDVALAAVGDGWVVAWADERNNDPEVYAVRVNRFLQAAGPEKRITNAKGTAADIRLLAREKDVIRGVVGRTKPGASGLGKSLHSDAFGDRRLTRGYRDEDESGLSARPLARARRQGQRRTARMGRVSAHPRGGKRSRSYPCDRNRRRRQSLGASVLAGGSRNADFRFARLRRGAVPSGDRSLHRRPRRNRRCVNGSGAPRSGSLALPGHPRSSSSRAKD